MAEGEGTERIDLDPRPADTFANQIVELLLHVDRESILHTAELICARAQLFDLRTQDLCGSRRSIFANPISIQQVPPKLQGRSRNEFRASIATDRR